MRALVVNALGAPPELRDVEEPTPGPGQALLEVLAALLNPVDLSVASGRFFAGSPTLPYVAGAEAVGRVVSGARFAPGTVVWTGMQGLGVRRNGTFASLVVAREDRLVPVPTDAEPAVAAALGIAGVAAWLPLEWRGRLRPGETVLVLGATGTLGLVAVQAAKLLGAGRVVAAGRRPEGLERALAAGADAAVPLGAYEDLAARLREACGGQGPTLVIDLLWGAPAVAALAAAAPGARHVQIGQSAGAEAVIPSSLVRGKALDVLGYTNLSVPHDVLASGYRKLVEHAASGRIAVELEQLPLERGVEAWQRQAEGTPAKLVLVP